MSCYRNGSFGDNTNMKEHLTVTVIGYCWSSVAFFLVTLKQSAPREGEIGILVISVT